MSRLLRVILLLGMLGTLAELILLEHTEDNWQRLPLVLLGVGVLVTLLEAGRRRRWARPLFSVVMLAFVASGAIGLYQHYQANSEFEREMYPTRAGTELVWESLKGATPTLAPAAMMYLGLVGFAYAYARRRAGEAGRRPLRL